MRIDRVFAGTRLSHQIQTRAAGARALGLLFFHPLLRTVTECSNLRRAGNNETPQVYSACQQARMALNPFRRRGGYPAIGRRLRSQGKGKNGRKQLLDVYVSCGLGLGVLACIGAAPAFRTSCMGVDAQLPHQACLRASTVYVCAP